MRRRMAARGLGLAVLLSSGGARIAGAADYFGGYGFYLGELHAHTGASGDGGSSDLGTCDGECGPALEVAATAAEYGLDFLTYTDHANGNQSTDSALFEEVQEAIRDAHDPDGGLVTLQAGELFFSLSGQPLGHKNIYFFADDEALDDLTMEDMQFDGVGENVWQCAEIWSWMAQMEETWGPVLLVPHHPGLPTGMGTDWSCHQGDEAGVYAPAVEIYSEHGDSSSAGTTFDPPWMGASEENSVEGALDPDGPGLRLGFVGGTDRHDTHPGSVCETDTEMPQHPYGGGLTVAVVPEGQAFDRSALHDAIVSRRTYATSGPLVPAIVEYWGDGQYLGGMGEELGLGGVAELAVVVRVPVVWDPFVTDVLLVGPGHSEQLTSEGDGRFSSASDAQEVPAYLYPMLLVDGDAWYGEEGCDDAGPSPEERIWLSPTWFGPEGPYLDDDDDSAGDDDSGDGGFMVDPEAAGACRCSGASSGPSAAIPLGLAALSAVGLRGRRGAGQKP